MIPNRSQAPQISRQRLVLDTNICLDLFMFRDPRWQALLDAIVSGEAEAVTRADCRKEFELVLAYEKMQLSAEAQAGILADYDRCIALAPFTSPGSETDLSALPPLIPLPVCKDGDDQKFLELAAAARADVLITKDKALLKLARKTIRLGLFRIFSPEAWVASFLSNPDLRK